MQRRHAHPTPGDLARRSGLAADVPWDRAAYERAIYHSDLHPFARLLAFVMAHVAADTGVIPAHQVPDIQRLARAAGFHVSRARVSFQCLEHTGWVTRPPGGQPKALRPIRLTIPARQPRHR